MDPKEIALMTTKNSYRKQHLKKSVVLREVCLFFLKMGYISAYLYTNRNDPVKMGSSDDATHWQAGDWYEYRGNAMSLTAGDRTKGRRIEAMVIA